MRRLMVALCGSTILAGSAFAADLPAKMYTKAPIAPAVYNWTGLYVGLNAGGSWGNQNNDLATTAGVIIQSNSAKLNGVIGGGQIGYNWQFNQLVVGIEADLDASGQRGDGSPLYFSPGIVGVAAGAGFSIPYTDKLDWFGTARGRIGWAMDRWLPYVTGGWAFGHGSISGTATIGGVASTFAGSKNYNGWTLGGGLEYAFMHNWSVKAEYLYIDFGNGPTVAVTPAINIVGNKMTDNILRAGLNYKF